MGNFNINKLRKNTNVPILFGVDFSTDHLCYGLNYAIYILIHVTPINIIFKITRIHKNTSMQLQISECAKTIIIIFVSSYFMFYNLIGAYFAHFQQYSLRFGNDRLLVYQKCRNALYFMGDPFSKIVDNEIDKTLLVKDKQSWIYRNA